MWPSRPAQTWSGCSHVCGSAPGERGWRRVGCNDRTPSDDVTAGEVSSRREAADGTPGTSSVSSVQPTAHVDGTRRTAKPGRAALQAARGSAAPRDQLRPLDHLHLPRVRYSLEQVSSDPLRWRDSVSSGRFHAIRQEFRSSGDSVSSGRCRVIRQASRSSGRHATVVPFDRHVVVAQLPFLDVLLDWRDGLRRADLHLVEGGGYSGYGQISIWWKAAVTAVTGRSPSGGGPATWWLRPRACSPSIRAP